MNYLYINNLYLMYIYMNYLFICLEHWGIEMRDGDFV